MSRRPQAAKAEPDGYTLLMANQGPMTVNPHLFKNVKIDPLTAFDPVTLIAEAPLVVVVPEDSPFTSFQQLVEEAKNNPGGLTYGSAGNGSASHLATLLLANTARLDMVHVPYKGAGPAITDLIGGRLDFMITTLPSVVGFIDSGKAKPLAVTMQERTKRLPDVPTIAESGWPDYQAAAWYGFAVPKGTPPEIVTKLRDATVAATNSPDVQQQPGHRGGRGHRQHARGIRRLHEGRVAALGRADREDRHHHRLTQAPDARSERPRSRIVGRTKTQEGAKAMAQGMEKPRDVVGGLVVMAIGAGFLLFGQELEMGTSFRMGPGYFPTILSILMIGLGAAMIALRLRAPHHGGTASARCPGAASCS